MTVIEMFTAAEVEVDQLHDIIDASVIDDPKLSDMVRALNHAVTAAVKLKELCEHLKSQKQ